MTARDDPFNDQRSRLTVDLTDGTVDNLTEPRVGNEQRGEILVERRLRSGGRRRVKDCGWAISIIVVVERVGLACGEPGHLADMAKWEVTDIVKKCG
jgi:hypothetical protein